MKNKTISNMEEIMYKRFSFKSEGRREFLFINLHPKRIISLVIACLFMCMNIYAYSVFDLYYGSEISHHDARVSGMGGAGAAGGFTLMDSSINPANLYFLDATRGAQMTYSLIKNSESRALPMWNFFDSFIGHSTYARNENFYNEFSFGAYYSLPLNTSKLSLGFVMRPVVNFGADYREEVRNDESSDSDNYPPIIAMNFIDSKGMLNSYNLLLNWGVPIKCTCGDCYNYNFSIGAEISYYDGKHEHEERIHWTDKAHELATETLSEDSFLSTKNNIDGIGFKFGLASQISPRVRLGLTYSPKVSLNAEFVSEHSKEYIFLEDFDDYIIPSKMRIGVLFRPRNPFRTNFHADFELINYEDIDSFFENGYALYVGMEHYVGRAIPLRLGFSHHTARQNKSISLPVISTGTSFDILNNLSVDLSAEYGKREYSDLDLFPDGYYDKRGLWRNIRPADRGWDNPDLVTESFFKMFASLSYKW